MTVNELIDAFQKTSENRPINWAVNDLDGFIHLLKLGWNSPGSIVNGIQSKKDLISCAEHEQIWLNVDLEWLAIVATLDDINYLVDCHIHIDDDAKSLYLLV